MKIRGNINEIDVAKMRDIVYLMPPTDTSDGRGGINRVYSTEIQVFAIVNPGGNARELQEQNLTYDNIITVFIRWYDLDQTYRIKYRDVEYTLHKSSDVDAKKRFLKLLCYAKT